LTASPQTITIVGFYHGDIRSYGEFLRKELYEPFSSLFEVCENPPNINDPDAVYAFFMQHNSPPLNNYVYERGDLDPQVRGLRGNHPEPRH
jgi:hypothetical protein